METPAKDAGFDKKMKLKRIKKKKSKFDLNASTNNKFMKSFSSRLNISAANSSVVKASLRANNKALAISLEKVRQDLRISYEVNNDLKKENQDMKLRLLNLERVAGLKDDSLEEEVQRRMEDNYRQLMPILSKVSVHLLDAGSCLQDALDKCIEPSRLSLASSARHSSLGTSDSPIDSAATGSIYYNPTTFSRVPVSGRGSQRPAPLPAAGQLEGEDDEILSCQQMKEMTMILEQSVMAEVDELDAVSEDQCVVISQDLPEDAGDVNIVSPQITKRSSRSAGRRRSRSFDNAKPDVAKSPVRVAKPDVGKPDRRGTFVVPVPVAQTKEDVPEKNAADRRGTFVLNKPATEEVSKKSSKRETFVVKPPTKPDEKSVFKVPMPVSTDENIAMEEDHTIYLNTDMELTEVISFDQTATSSVTEDGDGKTEVKEKKTVEKENPKSKIAKSVSLTSIQSKEKKDLKMSKSDTDISKDEPKSAVTLQLRKPGKIVFSATRKQFDGTRKALPSKLPARPRTKSKKEMKELKDAIAADKSEPKTIFDFHDKTPTHLTEKSRVVPSVFDISQDQDAEAKEKAAKDSKDTESEVTSTNKKSGKDETKTCDPVSVVYSMPLKGSPDAEKRDNKRSRSRSRARSKTRKEDSDPEYVDDEPKASSRQARSRSRARSKKIDVDDDKELSPAPPRPSRSRSQSRKRYVELSDEDDKDDDDDVKEKDTITRKSRSCTKKKSLRSNSSSSEAEKVEVPKEESSKPSVSPVSNRGRSKRRALMDLGSPVAVNNKISPAKESSQQPEVEEDTAVNNDVMDDDNVVMIDDTFQTTDLQPISSKDFISRLSSKKEEAVIEDSPPVKKSSRRNTRKLASATDDEEEPVGHMEQTDIVPPSDDEEHVETKSRELATNNNKKSGSAEKDVVLGKSKTDKADDLNESPQKEAFKLPKTVEPKGKKGPTEKSSKSKTQAEQPERVEGMPPKDSSESSKNGRTKGLKKVERVRTQSKNKVDVNDILLAFKEADDPDHSLRLNAICKNDSVVIAEVVRNAIKNPVQEPEKFPKLSDLEAELDKSETYEMPLKDSPEKKTKGAGISRGRSRSKRKVIESDSDDDFKVEKPKKSSKRHKTEESSERMEQKEEGVVYSLPLKGSPAETKKASRSRSKSRSRVQRGVSNKTGQSDGDNVYSLPLKGSPDETKKASRSRSKSRSRVQRGRSQSRKRVDYTESPERQTESSDSLKITVDAQSPVPVRSVKKVQGKTKEEKSESIDAEPLEKESRSEKSKDRMVDDKSDDIKTMETESPPRLAKSKKVEEKMIEDTSDTEDIVTDSPQKVVRSKKAKSRIIEDESDTEIMKAQSPQKTSRSKKAKGKNNENKCDTEIVKTDSPQKVVRSKKAKGKIVEDMSDIEMMETESPEKLKCKSQRKEKGKTVEDKVDNIEETHIEDAEKVDNPPSKEVKSRGKKPKDKLIDNKQETTEVEDTESEPIEVKSKKGKKVKHNSTEEKQESIDNFDNKEKSKNKKTKGKTDYDLVTPEAELMENADSPSIPSTPDKSRSKNSQPDMLCDDEVKETTRTASSPDTKKSVKKSKDEKSSEEEKSEPASGKSTGKKSTKEKSGRSQQEELKERFNELKRKLSLMPRNSERFTLGGKENGDQSNSGETPSDGGEKRSRRAAASVVNYKEPSVGTKLRRGDPGTTHFFTKDPLKLFRSPKAIAPKKKIGSTSNQGDTARLSQDAGALENISNTVERENEASS